MPQAGPRPAAVTKPSLDALVRPRLIARPLRLRGVDLKLAEQVTHRLLKDATLTPVYHLPPSRTLPPLIRAFLNPPPLPDGQRSDDESPPFDTLPPSLDPGWRPTPQAEPNVSVRTPIPPARSGRKRAQIRFLVSILAPFLASATASHDEEKKDEELPKVPSASPLALRVHDLCAGCGHVGLVLAELFPRAEITLVDDGPIPLRLAASRAALAALSNVSTSVSAIQAAAPPCDVVVALHACGGASEAALARAVAAGANLLVVVPCCVGGVVAHRGNVTGRAGGKNGPVALDLSDPPLSAGKHATVPELTSVRLTEKNQQPQVKESKQQEWTKPRSKEFRATLSEEQDFESLLRAADYGESDDTGVWRRVAKSCVEWDRLLWLQTAGYDTRLVKLRPESASPKNDVLVAWRRDSPTAVAAMQSGWSLDDPANTTIANVRERVASCILGNGEQARSLRDELMRTVLADDAPGVYTSPPGTGRQLRKLIHGVADMLGLSHKSIGKGVSRVVVVRRSEYWPVYNSEYVGLGGPRLTEFAKRFDKFVPQELVKRRVDMRGPSVHITIVGPGEVTLLPERFKKDLAACAADVYEHLKGTSFDVIGIGRVKDLQEKASDVKQLNEAYFGVVVWAEAQAWRASVGLNTKDFHITLGFTTKDIHNAPKGASSIILPMHGSCSPWIT